MPVKSVVRHVSLVHSDALPTRLTAFSVPVFEACAAEGLPVAHDVALTAETLTTLTAGEVRHMPAETFGFCALIREDDLRGEDEQNYKFKVT